MPGVYNFTIYQRSSFRREVTWTDSEEAVVDLDGWAAQLDVREQDDTLIFRFSTSPAAGEGLIEVATAAPNIVLTADDSDTAELPAPALCSYDLVLTSPAGATDEPLLTGACRIRQAIVHD